MIAALFALAATMLIVGITAVVEGFPYVRLESGMAMVYGGSVVASSGLLLFGLAVVATWLKRIAATLGDISTLRPAAASDSVSVAAPEPTLAAQAGAAAERTRIEPSLAAPTDGLHASAPIEPELLIPGLAGPLFAVDTPAAADAAKFEPAKVEPAKLEPAKPSTAETKSPASAAPDSSEKDDLFVQDRPEPGKPAAGPTLRPSLDAQPEAVLERTVVGRYSSGGNTYMMYADGAIEAETPDGRYTFASLDELKAFVDGGGELGTRGAA